MANSHLRHRRDSPKPNNWVYAS